MTSEGSDEPDFARAELEADLRFSRWMMAVSAPAPGAELAGQRAAATLGERLLERGLVSPEQLERALEIQRSTRSRLGDILVASGELRRVDLGALLADAWGLAFADLTRNSLDASLLETCSARECIEEQWVPIGRAPDGVLEIATADQANLARESAFEARFGMPVRFLATTSWDISAALRRSTTGVILEEATLGLWRRDAARSARVVLSVPQRMLALAALAALVGALVLDVRPTVATISGIIAFAFLVSVAFKFVVCFVGSRYEYQDPVTVADVATLDEASLPTYTILVPAYREAEVIGDLIDNLSRLNYPREKLEILILLEEQDEETRQAAIAAAPPGNVTFITIPSGRPQTKPKACNVGLYCARGDYLVIYDAEDRPDADQLKMSVIAFERGGPELVCVQAALNYFNDDENALTRMFTIEYSFWFDYMLRGLEVLRLPIPLGGTSNHFRTQSLRQLGGWDPFNVTEDADLGIRAATLGYRVGVIPSTTFEEANRAYGNFIRQRSRWIKGYLQTVLVHSRHPFELCRRAGLRQSVAFALLIGGTPLAFLFTPPLYLIFVVSLALPPGELARFLPGWVLWTSLACLLLGNSLMIYASMMGAFKRRRYRLALWALLNPLYWLLHSLAAYKALWQLIVKPHYWEKTKHGLTIAHARASADDPGAPSMGH